MYSVATVAAFSLGYHTLLGEQKKTIITFLKGNDDLLPFQPAKGRAFAMAIYLNCAFGLFREEVHSYHH